MNVSTQHLIYADVYIWTDEVVNNVTQLMKYNRCPPFWTFQLSFFQKSVIVILSVYDANNTWKPWTKFISQTYLTLTIECIVMFPSISKSFICWLQTDKPIMLL